MIAADTNFVVRLLVEDDSAQLREVHAILAEARATAEECLITDIVLCELTWVLEGAYRASRADVLAAVQALLSDSLFGFEDRNRVLRALDLFEVGRADFSDYLLGVVATDRGARTTFTFDRALRGEPGFTVRVG